MMQGLAGCEFKFRGSSVSEDDVWVVECESKFRGCFVGEDGDGDDDGGRAAFLFV